MHLVTDYLFYNKYLDKFTKDIYNDYDIINKSLIEKYNIEIPKEIENCVFYKEGKTKLLHRELAERVIDEVSTIDIYEVEKEIKENPNCKKWNTYKKLS